MIYGYVLLAAEENSNSKSTVFLIMCLLIRGADLHHFNADSDPGRAFHFYADADLDPDFLFDSDTDPAPHKVIRICDH